MFASQSVSDLCGYIIVHIFIMKCNQGRDCYFFQDCQFYPKMNLCHGYCEWSGWSIEVVIWTIVMIMGILVACFRCQYCPFNRFLVQRGNLPENKVPAGMTFRNPSSSEKSTRNIASFEEVVLVRSLSEK